MPKHPWYPDKPVDEKTRAGPDNLHKIVRKTLAAFARNDEVKDCPTLK